MESITDIWSVYIVLNLYAELRNRIGIEHALCFVSLGFKQIPYF